jgi:hypothetical protein
MIRRLSILVALVATFTFAGTASAAPGNSVIYSSVVASPLHGNMPSVGGEAYAFSEFGNAVNFSTSKNRSLSNVVVTMSSWGCQSGHWTTGDCLTTNGATFSVPITFTVYAANGATVIASSTQTFAIPYRPSASSKCTGGRWFDNALKSCFNGLATNITFNFGGAHLPDSIVFGIAYNTTHFGYNPVGESASCFATSAGCGYDSLNIALSNEPTDVSSGSDVTPSTVWQNSPLGSVYCDGGLAGTNTFRLDSPTSACWSPYIPAVQIKAGG